MDDDLRALDNLILLAQLDAQGQISESLALQVMDLTQQRLRARQAFRARHFPRQITTWTEEHRDAQFRNGHEDTEDCLATIVICNGCGSQTCAEVDLADILGVQPGHEPAGAAAAKTVEV